MTTLFVTATDTGDGKTFVASSLLWAMRARGHRVCGFKPVASGSDRTDDGLRNSDALALQEAAATDEPYELINPYAFEPANAPHLAARDAGVTIDPVKLDQAHAALASRYDCVVIEGAGGWQVPLNDRLTFADWIGEHRWPVLLVVGMRLGCINHALLSVESIVRRTKLMGWVANVLTPEMPRLAENIAELERRIPIPRIDLSAAHQGFAVARLLSS